MANEVYDELVEILNNRSGWEEKQRVYDAMCNEGMRRKKPFPNAADLHFKLVDRNITKWKPFYFQQIFSGPRIAEFTSLKNGQRSELTESAADYFDFCLKESNYWRELLRCSQYVLQRGRFVMKVLWD
jgi:hypothetical protein